MIEALEALPDGQPRAILIRHAARESIHRVDEILSAPITEAGRADAIELGGRLADRTARATFWHSPIARCGQTAAALVEGYAAGGGDPRLAGVLDTLGGSYLLDAAAAMQAFVRDRQAFVRHWFDGELSPDVVLSRAATAALHLDAVRTAWVADAACLHVFVTHDLNLLALREQTLGLRHEDAGWMRCLDGLAVGGQASSLVVTDGANTTPVD